MDAVEISADQAQRPKDAASISMLHRFGRCERGATSIEYGLICSLIFVAIVVAVQNFATANSNMYNNIKNKI